MQLSNTDVGFLRDKSAELLGQRVRIEGIPLQETRDAKAVTLSTRSKSYLVVSHVELYSHLVEGTTYKKRFDDADRSAGQAFVFPVQGGMPAVSMVLPNQKDAIAVIKQLIAEDGTELSWAAALERLGIHRSQLKEFIEIADGMDMTGQTAGLHHVRLEPVPGLEDIQYDLRESPKPGIPNLDSTLKMSSETRQELRELLPKLLEQERLS